MLLMGGDQLTGKSTLGKNLARLTDAQFVSVGALFREAASERGISVAELARSLRKDVVSGERGRQGGNEATALDAQIDLRTCELIGGRDLPASAGIIEGRQPAFMGQYMQTVANKQDIVSIYLRCSPRERALRFLKREVSLEVAAIADASMPPEAECTEETDYVALFAAIDGVSREALSAFAENVHRDADDRARYQTVYGIDYGDMAQYDTVVDTSNASAEQNLEKCVKQLLQLDCLPEHFRKTLLER